MKLNQDRFAFTEHANQNLTITIESGTTLDDVLDPEFLTNVASRLHPYDRIVVRVDSGEWYAELLVLSCGRAWAKAVPIFVLQLTTKDVEITQAEAVDDYVVQFRGPHLKFCILRKSDNEPIKEQLQTKVEAQAWLASYAATISR